MKIRMKSTQRGADDGFTVRTYFAGHEYDLRHTPRARELAEVLVREGWAEEVGQSPPPQVELPAADAPPAAEAPPAELPAAAPTPPAAPEQPADAKKKRKG